MSKDYNDDNASRTVAEILLNIEAVHYQPDRPFTFTSGTVSPVYVDCRKIISFVSERREVIHLACAMVEKEIGVGEIDCIAGGETAGIPLAAWLSEALDLPMIYVRKKPKGFGRLAQVEGFVEAGKRVLLVEDLMFDATSKLNFCDALVKAGTTVKDILVMFDYGIEKTSANLRSRGFTIHAMSNWHVLLRVARGRNYLEEDDCNVIQQFLERPNDWARNRGDAKCKP